MNMRRDPDHAFSLMSRLMLNSIVITILAGVILLVKRLLKNHLTWGVQYGIWYLFLFVLMIPFLPCSTIYAGHDFRLLSNLQRGIFPVKAAVLTSSYGTDDSGLIEDFSISVSRTASLKFPSLLLGVWGIGIGIGLLF